MLSAGLWAGQMASARDYGFAGILSSANMVDLPQLTLSVGKPVADGPLMLKSGTG